MQGPAILPHQKVQLMAAEEFEVFVEEWGSSQKPKRYARIERHSGAGDMGIDVGAFDSATDPNAPWDNYQCKHYNHALQPNEVLIELGKVLYYTWRGMYTIPRKYYFCAPHDVGSTLAKLLRNAPRLKEHLRSNWTTHCEKKLHKSSVVPLSGSLLEHFEKFDFSVFSYIPVAELLEGHKRTNHHVLRFGGGLPDRKKSIEPPPFVGTHETVYVNQLLQAYADHLDIPLTKISEISKHELVKHFERSRREFYCAEGLREFSKDHLPIAEYERLKDQFLDALTDTIDSDHDDGYARVKATVKHSQLLQIDSHPLKECMNPSDRAGICHQLANEQRVEWVKR